MDEGSGKSENSVMGDKVAGDINVAGGDFIGVNRGVITGSGIAIGQSARVIVNYYQDKPAEIALITAEIDRIRGRITRLIPVEEAIIKLYNLREASTIGVRGRRESATENAFEASLPLSILLRYSIRHEKKEDKDLDYLDQISEIQSKLSPDIDPDLLLDSKKSLSVITDDINIKISRLHSDFVSLVHSTSTNRELADNLVSKIGHRDLHEEAALYIGGITQLIKRVDIDRLTDPKMDVIGDDAIGAIGIMTELEKRRLTLQSLVKKDRSRRNLTAFIVIIYIILAISAIIYVALGGIGQNFNGNSPLNQQNIPLLGIPWPVILWSLIGSFAAMIYRFNRRPIYDFGDTIKWMLTRPVQGVVLGSAFYLVLISGLFLLTGRNIDTASNQVASDAVVLILSFLVGFSDRFADSVFNTLVDRYTMVKKESEDGTVEEKVTVHGEETSVGAGQPAQ